MVKLANKPGSKYFNFFKHNKIKIIIKKSYSIQKLKRKNLKDNL